MKLTGKTKEDFWKWYLSEKVLKENKLLPMFNFSNENVIKINFLAMSKICQNALIIEFFDSVKIYISINYVDMHTDLRSEKGFQSLVSNKHLSTMFRVIKSRPEATDKAIEKANEIYNEMLNK